MSRDNIKIIEFGMDDDPRPASRSPDSGTRKIIEFDNDREDNRQRFMSGKNVGHIKIIEFDDEPPKKQPKEPEKPKATVGPVKIIEFDKESETLENTGGIAKIKIIEFD